MTPVYTCFIDAANKKVLLYTPDKITELKKLDILENVEENAIIFTNLMDCIIQRYPGGIKGRVVQKYGKSFVKSYRLGKVVFRSFSLIISGQSTDVLRNMFPKKPIVKAMYLYLESLGRPDKIKHTFATIAKKEFYKEIKAELWNERKTNKNYYYDLDTYYDMRAYCKKGLFSTAQIYAKDLAMFDKKSAYPSVMISDNIFPIGKVKLINCPDTEYILVKIKDFLRKRQWFKIVFEGFFEEFDDFFCDDSGKTALEYYGIKEVIVDGRYDKLVNIIKKVKCKLYKTQKTGYLSKTFRNHIMEKYEEKERLPKDSTERFFIKTSLNLLYGKGIQKYCFETKEALQNHYRGIGHGDNYLTPEMSLHCLAKVKYELKKAIITLNGQSVYFDTDGIKTLNTVEAHNYFLEENKKIYQENIEAGFESKIGIWDFEGIAQEFISVGSKRYIIKKDNKLKITWSGNFDKDSFLDFYGKNVFEQILQDGYVFTPYFYAFYDKEEQIVKFAYDANEPKIEKWNGLIM